ncbi:MAG: hypothetical protein WBY94_23275 [Polyangiaceae bacterium]
MKPREEPRPVRRAATLAILSLALFVAFALLRSRHDFVSAPKRPLPPDENPPGESVVQVPPSPPKALARTPSLAQPAPDPPPVIDEISVEKPEVCSGEENMITVRAHTTNGTDAFLHGVVDGAMGTSVPVRLWLDEAGRVQGTHSVTVFGRTNTPVTVPLPDYRVRDCQPARLVAVEQHLRANTWGDFDFIAKIVVLPPRGRGAARAGESEFTPTSFVWSFGDGTAATTFAPVATHTYEGRAQDALYSYFTVRVEVHSKQGGTLAGRTTLPLINPAFEALARKSIVQLLIALDPRFPELGPDGRVVQHVRIWHTRPEPVTIESATRTAYFETGSGQSRPEIVDPVQLLGTNVIPPGQEGIATTVVLDTIADPGVFSATYRVAGKSQDGLPAMGSFSVLRPPPRPTAENSRLVKDPALTAQILAARAMLGKDVVTDEDIWQLQREQRLPRLTSNPSRAEDAPARPPPYLGGPQAPSYGPPVPTSVTPPPAITAAAGVPRMER